MTKGTHIGLTAFFRRLFARLFGPIERGKYRV